jgi:hypothetical protein
MGCSLLQFTPMSDERRAAFDREEERERAQLEREAARRREDAAERAADLAFRGVEPTSVGERLAAVSFAQDRADAREARLEREAAELAGRPKPTVNKLLRDAEAERKQREAEEAETPATVAELGKVKASLERLKHGVFTVTGYKVPL